MPGGTLTIVTEPYTVGVKKNNINFFFSFGTRNWGEYKEMEQNIFPETPTVV